MVWDGDIKQGTVTVKGRRPPSPILSHLSSSTFLFDRVFDVSVKDILTVALRLDSIWLVTLVKMERINHYAWK